MSAYPVPPCAKRGEGNHAQHGGGVSAEAFAVLARTSILRSTYPSTTLRVVPLPIVPMGRNCQDASL
jgi:hypothetical protein